ncbi:MAG: PAS domain-containing protein [Ghiorsea sp.]
MQIDEEMERRGQGSEGEAYLCFNHDGVIMDASASVEAILGFRPQVLIGKPMTDLCVYSSALHYLDDLMLLHGYAGNFRICLQDAQHRTHLFACCAVHLTSPNGGQRGTELLLQTLSPSNDGEACANMKVSRHGTILQANTRARSMLSTWDCQLGGLLPDDLAVEAHQAWSSGKVMTTQKKKDVVFIFVPQAYLGLVSVHILVKTQSKDAELASMISKVALEEAHLAVQ